MTAGADAPPPGIDREDLLRAFPFEPYQIQVDFMTRMSACLTDGQLGLFESPTGTGKTMSIICALVTWLKSRVPPGATQGTDDKGNERPDDDDDDFDALDESGPVSSPRPTGCAGSLVAAGGATKRRQVFFATRTHTQMAQFVGEFKKVPAAAGIRVATVASRQLLCVHPKVRRLAPAWRINDECLQLQAQDSSKRQKAHDGDKRSTGGCGFRCKGDQALDNFADALSAAAMDIEDLKLEGERRVVCPYYASRRAVEDADIVVMPYNCLIHKETRDALNIDVKGNIVVIDEAHNLVSAIHGSHSVAVSASQLQHTADALAAYLNRFQSRLGPGKAAVVTQLKGVVERLLSYLRTATEAQGESGVVQTPNQFLMATKLSNINLPGLIAQQDELHLVQKVAGFSESLVGAGEGGVSAAVERAGGHSKDAQTRGGDGGRGDGKGGRAAVTATLFALVEILRQLSGCNAAGRVLVSKTAGGGQLKYILLDAASKFAATVREAHAVVLASGTLSPTALLTAQLFQPSDTPRLTHFSCGHVVAPHRLLALGLARGPQGPQLRLTAANRGRHDVVDACGEMLLRLCGVVPEGLVVFAPSFAFLDKLRARWQHSGLLNKLQLLKRAFWEHTAGRTGGGQEGAFAQYTAHLRSRRGAGALLMCVVGGKLSEGINFGDELGRCIVALGLPYPDLTDLELRERLQHADACAGGGSGPCSAGLGKLGREMYENLCMQAVNQSVGRGIRHSKDYAAVVMVDVRYTCADGSAARGVVGKLPSWLTQRWHDCVEDFQRAEGLLREFYATF